MARRAFHRTDRLGRQVKQALALALSQGTREVLLHEVVVTDVEVTRDLSLARVYYYLGAPEHQPDVERALERAGGFLRGRVGEAVRARQIPELRFIYDHSVEHGRRVEEILAGLQGQGASPEDPEAGAEAPPSGDDDPGIG